MLSRWYVQPSCIWPFTPNCLLTAVASRKFFFSSNRIPFWLKQYLSSIIKQLNWLNICCIVVVLLIWYLNDFYLPRIPQLGEEPVPSPGITGGQGSARGGRHSQHNLQQTLALLNSNEINWGTRSKTNLLKNTSIYIHCDFKYI